MHEIQEKLLRLIEERKLDHLTLREIGAFLGETQPQKIKHHLTQLERKGLIVIGKREKTIRSTSSEKLSTLVSVPILGGANCGPANIFADANVEGYLRVSKKILSKQKDVYALKASGNSLNKADINGNSIEDGDYVIVEAGNSSIKNGNYVASVIDGMANIKRYYFDKDNNQIVLISDSTQKYPPIYIHENDDFLISGKVIQVIKKPKLLM